MTAGNWISIFSIIIAFLVFLLPIVFYAGKISAKLETMIAKVGALEKSLEACTNSFQTKGAADSMYNEILKDMKTCWGKYDALKKNVLKMWIKTGEDITKLDI